MFLSAEARRSYAIIAAVARARQAKGAKMADVISVDKAIARMGQADTLFIDVREPQELPATGILPGAIIAPMSQLQAMVDRRSPDFQPAFASGKELIFYCATGHRSASAAEALARIGIPRTVNLTGGIVAWLQAKGPVVPA
jgi:rhodanese-related sulfurtransferase